MLFTEELVLHVNGTGDVDGDNAIGAPMQQKSSTGKVERRGGEVQVGPGPSLGESPAELKLPRAALPRIVASPLMLPMQA